MDPKHILAANLRALMDSRPNLDSLKKIVSASDGRLTNGTLQRIRAASHATDIGKLAELSQVFEVEPWQLLVPNLNPRALPHLDSSDLLGRIQALVLTPKRESVTSSDPIGESPMTPYGTRRRVARPDEQFGPALKKATKLPGKGASHGDREVAKPASKQRRNRRS